MSALGEKVRRLRKEKGLTLEQLAEQIGAGKAYVWELENRGVKRPSAERLQMIAQSLDVTSDYLLDDDQTEPNPELGEAVFFRKLRKLSEEDRQRIEDLVDVWSKRNK